MTILGYPVIGQVKNQSGQLLPLVDIPMMSDQRWQELATKNAVENFTKKHGKPPESPEIALAWQRERADRILKDGGYLDKD